jgi:hypothetical protein
MKRRLAILLLLGCVSCAMGEAPHGTAVAGHESPSAPGSATLSDIRKLIGSASCTDSTQCHSLPIGARGCGGPEFYLAWSSMNNQGDQLRALAQRYKAEREAQNMASGRVSDCRFAVDPGATCSAGTCQLRTDPLRNIVK